MKEERTDNFRQRDEFDAVCSSCKKKCKVPFKPADDRPVYCKDCFTNKRR